MLPVINQPHKRFSNAQVSALLAADHGRGNGVYALFALWLERWFMRRQMARDLPTFTPGMLDDFGMSRQEALAEIGKPFWRA